MLLRPSTSAVRSCFSDSAAEKPQFSRKAFAFWKHRQRVEEAVKKIALLPELEPRPFTLPATGKILRTPEDWAEFRERASARIRALSPLNLESFQRSSYFPNLGEPIETSQDWKKLSADASTRLASFPLDGLRRRIDECRIVPKGVLADSVEVIPVSFFTAKVAEDEGQWIVPFQLSSLVRGLIEAKLSDATNHFPQPEAVKIMFVINCRDQVLSTCGEVMQDEIPASRGPQRRKKY